MLWEGGWVGGGGGFHGLHKAIRWHENDVRNRFRLLPGLIFISFEGFCDQHTCSTQVQVAPS